MIPQPLLKNNMFHVLYVSLELSGCIFRAMLYEIADSYN